MATPVTARPYRVHFGAVYAVLAAVLVAAAVAAVVLVARDRPAGPPAWSAWQPVGSADDRIAQITSFVSDEYQLPDGSQFSVVRAGPPTDQGVPVSSYAIHRPSATGQQKFDTVSTKNSIVYTLSVCGVTQDCTKLSELQSAVVSQALRREALELALYTFRYVGDTSSVLVELPALTQNGGAPAVFLQKSDVAAQLERPLRHTLKVVPVYAPGLSTPAEVARINTLTGPHFYQYTVRQDASGAPLILLDPIQL